MLRKFWGLLIFIDMCCVWITSKTNGCLRVGVNNKEQIGLLAEVNRIAFVGKDCAQAEVTNLKRTVNNGKIVFACLCVWGGNNLQENKEEHTWQSTW